MNRIDLIGNLANDPELKQLPSGASTCSFRLAVPRSFANQQGERETDFFTVVCWRQTAELAAKYLSKGRKAAIEGRLQTRSYKAQDGSMRYVAEVVADRVEFLTPRTAGGTQGGTAGGEAAAPAAYAHQVRFTEVDDDELPF